MTHILITGGTGLVGKHLCKKLIKKGYDVAILSRSPNTGNNIKTYLWDYNNHKIDFEAIKKADYIIHLAGANIAEKRWTSKRKQLIIDSRVKTGELIFDNVKKHKKDLKAFISASGVGYYGAVTSEKIFNENDTPATDFLGETCEKWELMVDKFQEIGIRTVKIRTGVVLTKNDGALSKMILPVKLGIGSAIGTGKQYMPWIHIEDLCNIYIKAIEDIQMKGAFNAVSPDHKTNKEFTKILAKILRKPFWFPNIPSFILKLLFGNMANILLKGSRVSAKKIQANDFKFQFPKLEDALNQLMGQN